MYTPEQIKQLISTNFSLHATRIPALAEGMQVCKQPGIVYVDSGLSCDTFNIIHVTDHNYVTKQVLSEAIEYYRSKKLAYCIWIDEENLSETIRGIFSSLHLSQQNAEPGMVLNLEKYTPVEHPLVSNIRLVTTNKELESYASVIASNWSPPDDNVITYFSKTAQHILNGQELTMLASFYENNHATGVIEMFPSDNNTIGLYGLATLASARGKGIGSALMNFGLTKARQMGYTTAILQASEDGVRIYQRMGFETYTMYYEFA